MDYNELLNVSVQVGDGLLENGGEVSRVEESIRRIFEAYGVCTGEVFAIPSLILVSINDEEGHTLSKIKRIYSPGINLDKVERYNDLCRRICKVRPTPAFIREEIDGIEKQPSFSPSLQIFAGALVAFAFTLFYGGNLPDALCAVLCGASLKLTYNNINRFHTNAFFTNIAASFVPAVIALTAVKLGLATNYDKIIIGALMNLVPGVAITSFMRDIIAGDLIAGLTKLTESLLIASAIALGAGMAISAFNIFWGVLL